MLRNLFSILIFLFLVEGAWAQLPTVKEIRTDAILKYRHDNFEDLFNSPQEAAETDLKRMIANFVPHICKRLSLYRLSPWNPVDSVNGVARYHETAYYCEHIFGPAYNLIMGGGQIFTTAHCPDSKSSSYNWDIDGSQVGDAKTYWCKFSIAVPTRPETCPRQEGSRFGGPIIGSTGQKIREENDFIDGGTHDLSIGNL